MIAHLLILYNIILHFAFLFKLYALGKQCRTDKCCTTDLCADATNTNTIHVYTKTDTHPNSTKSVEI